MSGYKSVEDVNQFVDYFHSSQIKVVVEDPETEYEKGFMGKKEFTTYCLVTKKMGKDPNFIRHRFSEFEGFQTNMKSRYSKLGLMVPSVPPKRVIGKGEWNFVVERMYGLSLFVESFVENPFLAQDQAWLEFSFPSEVEGGMENAGEAYLIGALGHTKSVENFTDLFSRINEEITVIEYYTKATLEKFKSLQSAFKSCGKALDEAATDVQKWASEEEYLEPLGGKAWNGMATSIATDDKPLQSVTGLATYYEAMAKVQIPMTSMLGLFECVTLEHVVGLIESMKDLLKAHANMSSDIEKKKAELATLRSRKPDAKTEGKIMETDSILKSKEHEIDNFRKSFFNFTLPLFVRRRAALLKRLTTNIGGYSLVNSVGLQTASRKLFKSINFPSDIAINMTSAKLSELSKDGLTPLPDGFVHEKGNSSVIAHSFTSLFARAFDPSTASSLDAAYIASGKDMSMESVSNAVPALPPTPPPTSGNENGEFM